MTIALRSICLSVWVALAAFAAPLPAQQKSRTGVQDSSEGKAQGCLQYEPATVKLKGTISRETFPGPPNYESIEDGDAPETCWILHVDRSICVSNGDTNAGDIDADEPESNVSDFQLVWSEGRYARNQKLLDRRVFVTGKLFHSTTGHHHTKVLIRVANLSSPGFRVR